MLLSTSVRTSSFQQCVTPEIFEPEVVSASWCEILFGEVFLLLIILIHISGIHDTLAMNSPSEMGEDLGCLCLELI